MKSRREHLIAKLKDPAQFLTRAESDELGPVTSRDLAPVTGDSFVDSKLSLYTVEFTSGDTWPTWAANEQDAIERALDAVPSLTPFRAVKEAA